MHRSSASEFPNDNPLLHEGAVWGCSSPCGPLEVLALTPPPPRVCVSAIVPAIDRDNPPELPVELCEEPAEDTAPCAAIPASGGPFAEFVQALVSIAVAQGSAGAAAALPDLLEHGRLDGSRLDGGAMEALVASRLVHLGDAPHASERLVSLVKAWRAVLEAGDFSACGDETLNEWAAELLAALLAAPQRAQAMQYELRRRGVAAFGMVKLAA